jgi:hypothetical protein
VLQPELPEGLIHEQKVLLFVALVLQVLVGQTHDLLHDGLVAVDDLDVLDVAAAEREQQLEEFEEGGLFVGGGEELVEGDAVSGVWVAAPQAVRGVG